MPATPYSCTGEGLSVHIKSERMLCAEQLGSLSVMRGVCVAVFAVIAVHRSPANATTQVGINAFHCSLVT